MVGFLSNHIIGISRMKQESYMYMYMTCVTCVGLLHTMFTAKNYIVYYVHIAHVHDLLVPPRRDGLGQTQLQLRLPFEEIRYITHVLYMYTYKN